MLSYLEIEHLKKQIAELKVENERLVKATQNINVVIKEGDNMTREQRFKEFLEKLQQLSGQTGVYIETYGDQYYNPKLRIDDEVGKYSVDNEIFFDLNTKGKTYVAQKNNPYDGEELK